MLSTLSRSGFELFDVQNILTLKPRLEVTQGHWKWHHSIDRIRVPIRLPLQLWPYLYRFRNSEIFVETRKTPFFIPRSI